MFSSHVKIVLRTLYREKLYVLINVSGLSLGIACCLILGLFLHSELTYDRHHVNHKRIYRIVNEATTGGKVDALALTSAALAPLLSKDYPEIESYVRFRFNTRTLLRHGDDAFYWENVWFADENVFDVFTHEYIYGDPSGALTDPSAIAVSESFARKYFGDVNPIGETIRSDLSQYKITLVYADLPENTHLKCDALISYNSLPTFGENESILRQMLWSSSDYTYLVLPEGYEVDAFRDIIDAFYERYMVKIGESIDTSIRYWLEPLPDIHLESDLQYDQPTGNKLHVYGFSAVAIFILLVACINYMNLATARSVKRAREVGMRKVLGASRTQLILQFLGESVSFSLVSLLIGLVLVKVLFALTPIGDLLGKQELMSFTEEPLLLWAMLALSLVTGLVSGVYPAFYLSSVLPISALTTTSRSGKKGFWLRQFLVLLQFVISIGVIACTILMVAQMNYIANKPLGFSKENRVVVRLQGADVIEKVPTIRNELSSNSSILDVSTTAVIPGGLMPLNIVRVENNEGVMTNQILSRMPVGDDFIKAMGIPLIMGRDFSKKLLTDIGLSVVVNETMVEKMGWTEPLGKRVAAGPSTGRVIGVVEDFHFQSLHRQVEPLVMHPMQIDYGSLPPAARAMVSLMLLLHISGEEVSQTLGYLSDQFVTFDPKHPFEYEFLDDSLDELYMSERRLTRLTGIFSGICIFISCLGLFGLASFTTEKRTKEIGIRKVLGATTSQIILMLARSVIVIVIIAAVIASVTSFLAMDEWLSGFAYRAGVNPLVFLLSALIAISVAYVTIALQSFRTAQANPALALRYE